MLISKFLKTILICAFILPTQILVAETKYYPTNILLTDHKFSHHVILVEKSSHSLYLYENQNQTPVLLKKYQVATGQSTGNNYSQGDKRTPEGIYQLVSFISKEDLFKRYSHNDAKQYGAGAFPTNYPNVIDLIEGKTGGGIWIHSAEEDSRIDKKLDTKGCVALKNADLKELSNYIDLNNTSVIIVQDLFFIPQDKYQKEKQDFLDLLENWRMAWENNDIKSYLSYYHQKSYRDPRLKSYSAFREYKTRVFRQNSMPKINIENISILQTTKYAVITFEQKYESKTLQPESGKKILFLEKDHAYNWKIVSEIFSKQHNSSYSEEPFKPDNRFFRQMSAE